MPEKVIFCRAVAGPSSSVEEWEISGGCSQISPTQLWLIQQCVLKREKIWGVNTFFQGHEFNRALYKVC